MAFTNPTTTEFKAYHDRSFPYGSTIEQVRDADITKAIAQAAVNFNAALFDDQATYTLCFLWLAAHYLVIDLRAASQGVAGNFSWLQTSKSVGSVSESFTIPQRILDNPYFALIAQTPFGAKYLSLILPQLTGNVYVVGGATLP